MNSQNQPQEECSDFLPPIESISVEGEFDGMPFRIVVKMIKRQVMSSISTCTNQVNLCEDDRW